MSAPTRPRRRLTGPPGFPIERYTAKLRSNMMRADDQQSIAWRREKCKHSPILFALYYFREHLSMRGPDGTVLTSLAEFHIEMAMAAKQWRRRDLAPKEVRKAWVWPREAGKSTWLFLILTLWALAYGHRRYIVVYSDTEGIARGHLRTLRMELARNERLQRDFPELCEPMREGGRPVWNNAAAFLAANGSLIEVKGMNSATLGAKFRERRPDALFFDDIEPKEGNYSLDQKEKRLTDLREAIFPCNLNAVVQIVGTTVMHGSIIHDLIEGAGWVAAENITVHHYPGIIEDPVTGEERSCWPERWPLEYLRAERDNRQTRRGYAKNFDNAPISPDGTYWDDDDITYKPDLVRWLDDRILVIDPAAKSSKKNDETALAVLGWIGNVRKVLVERVRGVQLKPLPLRDLVHSIVTRNDIKLIVVDVTNGGDHVLNTLAPLPRGVKILPVNLRRSKVDRFTKLHDRYQRGVVVHARPITALEKQMKSYPKVMHDDQIDAVCLGVEYFLGELTGAVPVVP